MRNWPQASSLRDLTDHQREKYSLAANGSIGFLGGRPGGGKTFTLARIIDAIPQGRVAVAAPTGKANVRITESLRRAGVDGVRAKTIHSLLKVRSADNGWEFEHNADNPLPFDWIFVDEASMIDASLGGSLLSARAPGCKCMFIGDVNQLAPVGPGAFLRDSIAYSLPYGELIEIQRNSGRIVKACHKIIDEHIFEPSPKLDLDAESPENLLHIERRNPDQQISTLQVMLEKFRSGGAKIGGNPVDPVWDVQIIVPVNEKSPLCRVELNRVLQGFLNPCGEQPKGHRFRIGDKIVNGKNGFFPPEDRDVPDEMVDLEYNQDKDLDGKIYCCNGDLAKVIALRPKYIVARLWYPDRLVRIPIGESYENEEGEAETGGFSWDLAYALSCHKMQGSEAPVCITLADSYPGARMLCDRSWIYTALSRARHLAITLGQMDVIQGMCKKSHIWNRKTFLRETLAELSLAGLSQAWDAALMGV